MSVKLLRTLSAVVGLVGILVFVGTRAPIALAAGIIVNNFGDTSGPCATTGTGTCTLRDALLYANATPDAHVITFSGNGIITLASPLPAIETNFVAIDGSTRSVTIDGAGAYKVLVVSNTSTLNLTNLTIAHAWCDSASGGGGGVTNYAILNVTQVTFLANNSSDCLGGGAISNEGGTLNVSRSSFSGNTGGEHGGGAIRNGGTMNVTDSTFSANSASNYGGASDNGGAILNNGKGVVSNSKFSTNTAPLGDGGAIHNSSGSVLTIKNSTFSSNVGEDGAALSNDSGTLSVRNSTFTGNTTNEFYAGGAMYSSGGTLDVKNSTIAGNWSEYGGGIYVNGGTVNVTNSTLSGNTGWGGGGGLYNDSGTVIVTNSTFTDNSAKTLGNGGAMYNLDGTLYVVNSTIYGNRAAPLVHSAGGIYNDGDRVKLRNTIVSGNSGYNCYDYAASLSASKYNLDNDGSCGKATTKTIPQLAIGPLQNNGGATQTMAPGVTSAALGAGNNSVCAAAVGAPNYGAGGKDQRGTKRPQGTGCDVGAVEPQGE